MSPLDEHHEVIGYTIEQKSLLMIVDAYSLGQIGYWGAHRAVAVLDQYLICVVYPEEGVTIDLLVENGRDRAEQWAGTLIDWLREKPHDSWSEEQQDPFTRAYFRRFNFCRNLLPLYFPQYYKDTPGEGKCVCEISVLCNTGCQCGGK